MNDTELVHRLLAGQLRAGVCRLCLHDLSDDSCASLGDTVVLPSGETTLGRSLVRTCPELGVQSWLNSALSDKVCMSCLYIARMSPDAPIHRLNIEILGHYVEELYESLCNAATLADDAQTILIPLKAYNGLAEDRLHFTVPIKEEIEEAVVTVEKFESDFDTDMLIVMDEHGTSNIYEFTPVGENSETEIRRDMLFEKDNSKLDNEFHTTVDNSEPKKQYLKKCVRKKPTLLECQICQKKYCSVTWLTQHTLKTHGVIICEDCDEQFKDQESYDRHVGLHQVMYTCDLCGEGFKFKYAITLHLERHEKVKSQRCVCEVCGAHLWDATAKENHAARHDRRSGAAYTCYYCGRGYLGVVSFEAHIRKHEKAQRDQFECDGCCAVYASRAALGQHMRSAHRALRPHPCPHCGKQFALLATLRAHRERAACAQDAGTHHCQMCERSFVDARALKWHRRLHTGERPYRCDECGRDFISRNRRNQHALTAHTAPQRQCPLCPALFHLRSMVNTHIKKVHLTEHKRRMRAPRQRDVKWATEKVAFSELSVHVQTQLLDRSIHQGANSPL